jgi:hypothetical protein
MISVFMTCARTTGFDILKEPFEYRIEEVGVRHVIEVAEIDEGVLAAVHHCERNLTAFHEQTLIHTCSGTRGLKEPLAKTAACACDGLSEECLGRCTNESNALREPSQNSRATVPTARAASRHSPRIRR